MKLGQILKLIRTKRNISQKEMADILGISQNYLSLIEGNKKEPSAEKISDFAVSLGMSKEAIIFASTNIPDELNDDEKAAFLKLQNNLVKLLVFEATGEFRESA